MNGNHLTRLPLVIGLSVAAASANASPQQFMSSRSFAMAGTGVAAAQPAEAATSNPALMAASQHDWADDFGLILPSLNIRMADEQDTVGQIDDIQDTIDNIDTAIDNLDGTGTQAGAGKLREELKQFDGDTVRANVGLGLAVSIPSRTLAVGVFANSNLTLTARGEYSDSDDALLASIESGIPNPNYSDSLESRGKVLASAITEVGVSFAHALRLNNGQTLQLGISPKYVRLETFQYSSTVTGFDDEDYDNDAYQTEKSGFNMDLGAVLTFGDVNQWNAGLVVRNLIPMELDSAASKPELGEKVRTLELNPMVTAAIAHKTRYQVITAELDLTRKEGFGYEDDTQWLALGAEFDAWRYAQLRVGVRQNLASNDDNNGIEEKTQFTAGLGLNLMGVHMDIGALYSDADLGAALELGTAF